jgi:uncharacterized protein
MELHYPSVEITYDPAKRNLTLVERGLDFEDAKVVFAGPVLTQSDDRFDYGETRHQTYGLLDNRLVMIVWTETASGRRIISMRNCHDKESQKVRPSLG